ncbi:ABC transporter substrate-binding protein [Geodermatophilus sp. CPCC 206100]|uniref:ABC transporter substrate-binding protein n=1 Tax=Geodermatophilus sp. CPCC 206100 TaxID=3020054 RepID=UPI003B00724C
MTRRPPARLLAATGLVLALALTACGGDGGSAPADAGSPAAAEDAFPVSLESDFGTTEVAERPERVVVLGLTDADAVLALGVMPVALQQWLPQYSEFGVGPWAEDLVADAVRTGETQVLPNTGVVAYDPEQIATLAPDLIVAVSANIDQATFDQLSELAPVVARPPGTVNFGVPLEDSTMAIGRALGLEDEAAALVEETEALYAAAAEEHPEFAGRTATVARPTDTGYAAWLSADGRQQIMARLGFAMPPGLTALDDGAFSAEVSRERLDVLEADVLVVIEPQGFEDAVANDPVLQALEVVRTGRVVTLDADDVGGAMAYNTVVSARTVVDELVPQLSGALAG